jgi:signal transduction histidine kinase
MNSIQFKKANLTLEKANDALKKRVEELTAELLKAKEVQRQEIERRTQAEMEAKNATRAAEAAARTKSEFLSNMSHELRTPLNHILGFTELMLDKKVGELNETQEEFLNDVHSSGIQLLALINDILDLSKFEAGKLEHRPADIPIREILTNSLTMIKEKAMKRGITISTELDDIPEFLHADELNLKQILYNLLSNAVKFTPQGGSIHLAAKCASNGDIPVQNKRTSSKNFIQISVKDSGIGLQKENLTKIFQPFEQVEDASSRRCQGTGLGLSLAKSLVELNGGTIWAESDGEGVGAMFSFTLPV